MSIRNWIGIGAVLLLAAPASAVPLVLDFDAPEDGFVHGSIVNDSMGVTIDTQNFDNTVGHPDIAVAFDSEFGGATTDPDLLQGDGWDFGNIAPSEELNNILIVQENDACSATLCSDPDDQAGVGGQITFDYSALGSFDSFSFDLIDYQPGAGESGSIQFLLDDEQVGSLLSFDSFLGLGQSVTYGDNSANRIDLGTVPEFDKVVIALRGSAGIDNLVASPVPVPEPNTLALGGLGLVMLATAGRQRDRK